ncbi:23S rRNA pseudouridylate synthase [Leptospira perolatii]|uniref:Pseudouridine synthase n=1 Tax=Leptospira perolatii TaxID=2023191 RepID=A0A2M9ZKP5_9LEPT|nr:RluA family pseudouridine synthase [Leptospira perolatii]PJZ69962.1 23S rRNA pseudouridylate synthase [Leptospira perolatii]PJZ72630.1 23S rRNA pseudouridylate synthase [Leptospira perolatii]
MSLELTATVGEEWVGERIDRFLKSALGDEISRSSVQKWIDDLCVRTAEGLEINKSSYKVQLGEVFLIQIPPKPPLNLEPIRMDLEVLKESPEYLIIRKPPGIASHSGPGDRSVSLVNGLLYRFKELSQLGGEARPGIVHRLDKPTEGLMIIAKNDFAHSKLGELFRSRNIVKKYLAWVQGSLPEGEGVIDLPIARHPNERLKMTISPKGRPSRTLYKILKTVSSKSGRKFSLVEATLETGRTHQIRVHFQSQKAPIVGDLLYSKNAQLFMSFGLMLLSYHLSFQDPFTGENVSVTLPLPERFQKFETGIDKF